VIAEAILYYYNINNNNNSLIGAFSNPGRKHPKKEKYGLTKIGKRELRTNEMASWRNISDGPSIKFE